MGFVVLFLFSASILYGHMAGAQPSTAPPSSVPVTPLSSATTGAGCDLCRPLDGRKGSDLQRHRLKRDRGLHPHKKTPGISRSPKRSLKSQLPHRKLGENEEGSQRE